VPPADITPADRRLRPGAHRRPDSRFSGAETEQCCRRSSGYQLQVVILRTVGCWGGGMI
jgi:hypothetical protein